MSADRTLENLRRRLERWELKHLRKLAVELQERLERAEADAAHAWIAADQWREDAMELTQTLMGIGGTVGITQQGHLVAQVDTNLDDPLVERRGRPIDEIPS